MGKSRIKSLKRVVQATKVCRPKIKGKQVIPDQAARFERSLVGDLLRAYGPPSARLVTLPVRRLAWINPRRIRKGLKLSRERFSLIFGLPMATIRQAEKPGAKLSKTVQLIYGWINYDPAQLAELHGYSLRWYNEHTK